MNRLHRSDDAGRRQSRDVGRIGNLEMLDAPATVLAIFARQTLVGGNDLRIGRIADGMDCRLEALCRGLLRLSLQFRVGQEAQAARVGLVRIWLLQIGAARSESAVRVELHTAKPQPVTEQPVGRTIRAIEAIGPRPME